MLIRAWLLVLIAVLAGCSRTSAQPAAEPSPATVAAAAETAPTVEDGANGVAIWVHPQDGAKSLILGAGGTGGLEVYGLDGALRQRIGDHEASHVTVRYNFDLGGRKVPLVIAYEPTRSALIGYTIDESTQLIRLPGEPIIADDELTGLCSFQSPITGRVYALGMTDGGQMLQWQLFAADGALTARLVRSVPLGKGVEYCVVDDASATMYYGDEVLGVVSLPVEPETDPMRKILDLPAPRGGISEEVKGLALARGADGKSLLIVSDVSAERFSVYDVDGKLQSRFQVGAGGKVDAVGEIEGLALATAAMGSAFPEGLLVVADQDNDGEHSNFKLIGWREVRAALGSRGSGVRGSARAGGDQRAYRHARARDARRCHLGRCGGRPGDLGESPGSLEERGHRDRQESRPLRVRPRGPAAADPARRSHEQRRLARWLHGRRQGAHDRCGQQPHRQVDCALLARSGDPEARARGRAGADGYRRSLRALHVRGCERALRLRQQQ